MQSPERALDEMRPGRDRELDLTLLDVQLPDVSGILKAELRLLLGTAEAATQHAAKITQQLLAFARRSTFAAEIVCISDLFTVSEGFLRRAAGGAIEVDFACASEL